MKVKKSSKKIVSIVLAMTLIITSLPMMLFNAAATNPYDPAPYFDDAAQEKGASAWLDDAGNVQVVYPAATAQPTFKGEPLSIAFYILELVDTGANDKAHTNSVIKTIKSTGTSATFKAADIGEIDLESKRYSVTVTAVDTENWFSLPLYATVVKVPAVTIDSSRFANLSSSPTAAREMTTFDSETSSDNTAVASGNALQFVGIAQETGTVDLTDYVSDTPALRFIMHNQPSGTQSFYTAYSRQTWDFKGAEEVWYWLDFTDVSLQGVAFTLGAQCKTVLGKANGEDIEVNENEVIHYSTKGTTYSAYTGEAPYVHVQRADGGWNKVMMTNGTIDLANFKGYVRVPVKFFCSTEDRYITATNAEFGTDVRGQVVTSTNNPFASSSDLRPKTQANGDAYVKTLQSSTPILADPAGTCITEALMLQFRRFNCAEHKKLGVYHGSMDGWNVGYMPAAAVGADDADDLYTQTSGEAAAKRATVNLSAGTITRNENTYRAIEDLKTMGFSFENCTADSLNHSFYVDNVFFYRTDGKEYSNNSLDNTPNTGKPISNYYDEELTIQNLIFDEIDKYIVTPGWEDYREINYILELIDAYRQIFAANGKSVDFLDLSKNDADDGKVGVGLAAAAEKLKRDSWAKAWKAYEACVAEGTYGRANAGKFDLLPTMIRLIEKLPHPDSITTVSAALRDEIIKLWKGYTLLNLGQLEMLGKDEEEIILKYIALIEGNVSEDFDEFVVGTSLSNRPFILFDDFENYNLGTKSYQLEDAPDIYYDGETAYTDYRYTKNFVTYMPDTFEDFGGKSKDTDNSITAFLWGKQPTKNGFADNLIANAAKGEITDKGFQGSKGATVLVDGNFYKSGEGYYNVVSTTYRGAEAANIDALRATGTGNSNVLLGNMAKSFSSGEIDPYLSLVFYADFTQITDFNVSVTIQTYFDDTLNDFQIAMGTAAKDQNFFILDEESGEWIQANNAENAGRMFAYTSRAGSDTDGDGVFDVTLAGYKGYIRIPLYHFKPGNNSQKLDESSLALNNIYRISIGVAPGSQAGADQMYGKSFTIDNVGFSYDPVQYSDRVATRTAAGIVDKNFDEFFGAKGLPAKEFEDFVDSIDLYSTSFVGDVSVARTKYNALTEYQKTVVTDAEALLREYELYANGTKEIIKATYTVSDITTLVNSLPDAIKSATTTGDNDIPYPGFSNGAVNYASMGIDRATADQIIEYYNNGYSRFSNEQKTSIMDQTVRTQFLNAYNMAMRMTTTLENIKVNAVGEDGRSGFLDKLTGLYTARYDYNDDGELEDKDNSVADPDPYKIGNFVSIEEKQEVANFKAQNYDGLPYYSKTSIDDGSIYEGLKNTSRGFTYFLNNTQTFTVDGEEINGGIIGFRDKMQGIYDNASTKIADGERFTADEIQKIKDTLDEYNAFLPAYYNVEELYELEQKILRLFPAVSGPVVMDAETGGAQVAKVELNNDDEQSMSQTVYVDMPYIAALIDHNVTLQAVSDLKLTQVEGTTYSALNSFTAGSLVADTALELSLVADTALELGEYDNLYPDEVFARIPIEVGVDPSIASRAPTGSVYEGSITFNVYETADIEAGLTGDDLVPITTLELPIVFTSTNGQNITTYKVEIPADQEIGWDDTESKDVSYTVEATLGDDKLTVGIADSNADGNNKNDLTSTKTDANGNAYKLRYDAENFTETKFTGDVPAGTKPTDIPTLTIKQEYWDAVPVGEYKTQLTYTVALGSST